MDKEFWENQAEKYKDDIKAVNFDPLSEELETFFLNSLIKDNEKVCDIGCGNGRTIINLAQNNNNATFYGVDFAEEMIEVANNTKNALDLKNVYFHQANATAKNLPDIFGFKFDKMLTKRLLINLKGANKYKAIENIHSMLNKNGVCIMVECFVEPLIKIMKSGRSLLLKK